MCLLVYEKKWTRRLSKDEFNSAWNINSDWVGILLKRWSNLAVRKVEDREVAWWLYNSVNELDYEELIIHFRMWTSWGKGVDKIHPFTIADNTYLFHNWVIAVWQPANKSDTEHLADIIKSIAPREELLFSRISDDIKKIGWTYNKFIIASPRGIKIINEDAGHWNEGTWYSNYWYTVRKYFNNY